MFNNNKNIIIIAILVIICILFVLLLSSKKGISSITLNKHYIKLYEGEKMELTATISPSDITDKVIWTSENDNVAGVSEGLVSGNKDGRTKVFAKSEDGKVSDFCVIDVMKKLLEEFSLDEDVINIQIGEDLITKPVIIPEKLAKEKINWTSFDSTIATIDDNGKITGVNQGIAQIQGELLGKYVNAMVLVGPKASSIELNKTDFEIEIGKSGDITATISPQGAVKENIIWESSDPNVVEVNNYGELSAKEIGSATIKATTQYSKVTSSVLVTVTKVKYEIKYVELNKTATVFEGEAVGTLPTMTKTGYKLLGWYTASSGGTKVSSTTIVNSNMTLYPHWEVDYCLPKDNRFSSYQTVAYSDTETFKYRIINYGNHDIVQIWVADASKQLKLGLAAANGKGRLPAEYIISAIPSNKSLVAVNGSLFNESTGSPNNGVIMHDGKVIKNEKGSGGCFGITKDSTLIDCTHQDLNFYIKNGILNSFSMSHSIHPNGKDGAKAVAHRTQICQVDKHNFAIISANNITTGAAARILYSFSGNKCAIIYNLDGGGSRKLYYRKHGGSLIKRFGGSRAIPDMLYFTE